MIKVLVTALEPRRGIAHTQIEYVTPCGAVVVPYTDGERMLASLETSGAEVIDLRDKTPNKDLVI